MVMLLLCGNTNEMLLLTPPPHMYVPVSCHKMKLIETIVPVVTHNVMSQMPKKRKYSCKAGTNFRRQGILIDISYSYFDPPFSSISASLRVPKLHRSRGYKVSVSNWQVGVKSFCHIKKQCLATFAQLMYHSLFRLIWQKYQNLFLRYNPFSQYLLKKLQYLQILTLFYSGQNG